MNVIVLFAEKANLIGLIKHDEFFQTNFSILEKKKPEKSAVKLKKKLVFYAFKTIVYM